MVKQCKNEVKIFKWQGLTSYPGHIVFAEDQADKYFWSIRP